MSDSYAVLGYPISHSKSPLIHALFADQTKQDIDYQAMEVQPGRFRQAVTEFLSRGGRGLNVTLPFKEEAWSATEIHTARADEAGAVNTIWIDGHKRWCGDNTDGIGLVRDLSVNQGMDLRGRRILVLGAGGAARGIMGPLLDQEPEALLIANRTVSRAEELGRLFAGRGNIRGVGYDNLGRRAFDLIINATSASLSGALPPVSHDVLAPGGACYDMMYGNEPTSFVLWGRRHGASTAVDGLGMLVEQAAESFAIWRGVRPDTASVIAALRAPSPKSDAPA